MNTKSLAAITLFVIGFVPILVIRLILNLHLPIEGRSYCLVIIGVALLCIATIVVSAIHISYCIASIFILVEIILSISVYSRLFSDTKTDYISTKITICILALMYITLLIVIYIISYKLATQECPKYIKYKSQNSLLKSLGILTNLIEKGSYKLRLIAIPALYLILILITILIFGIIYDSYNVMGKINNGFVYNNTICGTKLAGGWDLLYFSTTTFFTVGYGDIIPVGTEPKLIVQLEMVLAHSLMVIYLPILLIMVGNKLNLGNKK